jgi:hypothetical protein
MRGRSLFRLELPALRTKETESGSSSLPLGTEVIVLQHGHEADGREGVHTWEGGQPELDPYIGLEGTVVFHNGDMVDVEFKDFPIKAFCEANPQPYELRGVSLAGWIDPPERADFVFDFPIEWVAKRHWYTPTTGEYKGSFRPGQRRKTLAEQHMFRQINPDWAEWLMGWPVGWTSLEPLPRARWDEWRKGMAEGTFWQTEPRSSARYDPDVPYPKAQSIERSRRAGGEVIYPRRKERWEAIGNGQSPLAGVMAWDMLNCDAFMSARERLIDHLVTWAVEHQGVDEAFARRAAERLADKELG